MNLFDLIVLLALSLVGLQFWQIRAMTEMAHRYATQYCKKHHLQLITVARESTKNTCIQTALGVAMSVSF